MRRIFSRDIEYFLLWSNYTTLVEAGREIGLSQAALSLSIKRLEEEFGTKVIERERGGSRIRLTSEGRLLLEDLRKLNFEFNANVSPFLSGQKLPPLKVGINGHICAKYFNPFLAAKKSIARQIQVYNGRSTHLIDALHFGQIDVAIVSWASSPAEGAIKLKDDPIALVGLKSAFPNLGKIKSKDELEDFPRLYEVAPYQSNWTESIPVEKSGFYVDDHFSAKEIILSGLAIADMQLDYFTFKELKKLVVAPLPSSFGKYQVYFALSKKVDAKKKQRIMSLFDTWINGLKGSK